jgi:glycosyltransferase involved in cell wall biosynthesis
VELLKARIDTLRLQDNFRFLGLVPRRHVISLMRTCAALINPSFFEGWSSTVEEARVLGVPMLLSDLAVHREQMGNAATYFKADDAEELAARLRSIALTKSPVSEPRRPNPNGGEQVRRFAREFASVAEKAMTQARWMDVA